ncbi:hypothetical protein JTB14_008261 [Gonioctena quinquepunctata]|nr:hypothetical protein JTB14_008261 [Gonioctena quinquepunctata]
MFAKKLISVAILLVTIIHAIPENDQDFGQPVKKPLWESIFETIQQKRALLPRSFGVSIDPNQTCTLCHLAVDALLLERRNDMTNIQLWAEASYICSTLAITGERVCDGVIEPNVDVLGYIIDNRPDINGHKICALLLQGTCEKGDNFEWTIDIPSKGNVTKKKSDGKETFNVIQLTDIHYDPRYTEKKEINCGEPLCCQEDQPDASDASRSCGYWSSQKNADVPLRLVEATINHTLSQKFDYVYFTGDLVSHRVWSTSAENNKKILSEIYDKFSSNYKVPVYPILGNHEAHPVNTFSSDGVTEKTVSSQWLYDLVLEKWSGWFPADQLKGIKETLTKGGYYTVSPKKEFRIVVLNSNVCHPENWWLLYDDKDPYGQLKWLVEVLHNAEKNNEVVHILSHIPTRSCLKVWAREYRKIIDRFSDTISAQFYGHTHRDEFYVYYNTDLKPINVAWNGGSLMPDEANPDYKLYTIDANGFDVLDAETWTFNLTLANINKKIDWYKLYSFKQAFEVDSLLPAAMDLLVRKMAKNDTSVDLYNNYYYRNSDIVHTCDDGCKFSRLCEIVSTEHGEEQVHPSNTFDLIERCLLIFAVSNCFGQNRRGASERAERALAASRGLSASVGVSYRRLFSVATLRADRALLLCRREFFDPGKLWCGRCIKTVLVVVIYQKKTEGNTEKFNSVERTSKNSHETALLV